MAFTTIVCCFSSAWATANPATPANVTLGAVAEPGVSTHRQAEAGQPVAHLVRGRQGSLGGVPAPGGHGRRHSERRSSATECRIMHNHYGGAAALENQPIGRECAR